MTVTVQTVFLRDPADQAECERIFEGFYGPEAPVTNFVAQPPCCGAALALGAWAIGGSSVRVELISKPGNIRCFSYALILAFSR
jgi:hypothetical protein